MPDVGRHNLKHQSVGEIFARAKEALLPKELAASDLAQWVMSYDDLLRQPDKGEYATDRHDSKEYFGEWRREFMEYLAQGILQPRIPFYFASLFHIGRLWKVTQNALDDCLTLESPDYLLASAQNLVEESRRQKSPVNDAEAYQTLKEICSLGIQRHQTILSLARSWWQMWQSEVGEYRRIFNEIREYAGDKNDQQWRQPMMRLMLLASKSSTLHVMMIRHGVVFKTELASPQQATSPFGQPLVLMAAFTLVMSDVRYMDVRHLEHFFYDLIREERMAPYVQQIVEALSKKYGDSNPFVEYSAGQKAADERLQRLIKEHTLPNGASSIWLNEWEEGLSETLYTSLEFPPKGMKSYEEILDWAIISADSVIKRNLAKRRQPVESWKDFLQRIFQEEWVSYVGYMLSNANKKADLSQIWTVEDLNKLITEVAIRLNQLGYPLIAPIVTELRPK